MSEECDLEEKCPNWPDCHPDCVWWRFACERQNAVIEEARKKIMMIGAKAHLYPSIHSKEFLRGLDCAKVNADTFLKALKEPVANKEGE